jgi:hypothetical protein
LRQLKSGNYIDYQEAALLYLSLFPNRRARTKAVSYILSDLREDKMPMRFFAQRFLATLAEDLYNSHYWRDWLHLRYLRFLRDLRDLRCIRELSKLQHSSHEWRQLRNWRDWHGSPEWRAWLSLLNMLLTQEVSLMARTRLPFAINNESVDLLAILLGRVLYIEKLQEKPDYAINELHEIVRAVMGSYHIVRDDEAREVALLVLCYLSALSESEAALVLKLAEDMLDEQERGTMLEAIRSANLKEDSVRETFLPSRQPKSKIVRDMVE